MKKFSKKVKSILAISIALICAIAIAVTAIVIGKKKDNTPPAGGPAPELNKQAQQFLTSQKSFGEAIALRQDNSQNVFYADASKFENLLGQTFDLVNGKVLVMDNGSGWKSIYFIGESGVTSIEIPEEPAAVNKVGSSVYFENGKVIVQQKYNNTVGAEQYTIWTVLNVKADGTGEVLIQKKVMNDKIFYNFYAGENYFGLVYSDGTSAEIEIVSFNSQVDSVLTEIDIDGYGEPQVAFSEHSCLYEVNGKSSITFISNSAIKTHNVVSGNPVIYVGADKYFIETETSGAFTYELVKLSSSSEISITPYSIDSAYAAIYGKDYVFGPDNTFGSGINGYSKIVLMKKDGLGNLKTTDAKIAYYDYDMNLIAEFVSDVTDSIIASSSIYTETEINKGDANATETIAYTTYYLTANSGLISIEQSRTASSAFNFTTSSYSKIITGDVYRSDYVAVRNKTTTTVDLLTIKAKLL